MKKFFMLSLLGLVANNCFAAGAGYSDIENLFTFIGIILLIWGILEIILFFKIWRMTNDVNKLKNNLTNSALTQYEKKSKLRTLLIMGNKEEAKRLIIYDFILKIESEYQEIRKTLSIKVDETYEGALEKALNKPIDDYKNTLEKELKLFGIDVPECIKSMNTFKDFYSLTNGI